MARALEVPMYRLFTDEIKIQKPDISFAKAESARSTKQDANLRPFAKALSRMKEKDQRLLLHLASKMANRG